MAFTTVDELAVEEALALALVEFKEERFTEKALATFLSLFLSDPLRPGTFMMVRGIVGAAVDRGLLVPASGPRGGAGFRISATGTKLVRNVELPQELFAKRNRLDGERNAEASANAALMMLQLQAAIPPEKREFQRDLAFMRSVFCHWRDHGWLSVKQVAKISEIGTRHGIFVAERHYVGRAMDEWRQPHLDAERRTIAEAVARDRGVKAAEEAQRRLREQSRKAALDENRAIKVLLHQMEQEGKLDQLGTLVSTVFPGTTFSTSAKATAYAGAGSKQLRVCVAALAFGKPPALVWKKSGQVTQPGAESEPWQVLVNSPAFQTINQSGYK